MAVRIKGLETQLEVGFSLCYHDYLIPINNIYIYIYITTTISISSTTVHLCYYNDDNDADDDYSSSIPHVALPSAGGLCRRYHFFFLGGETYADKMLTTIRIVAQHI